MTPQRELHRRSLESPAGFWSEAARAIDWHTPPRTVLGPDPLRPRWFAGGRLNICFNALDRHVAHGRGDQVALIHDSPLTRTVRRITYGQLLDDVARLAGALAALGVARGIAS